MNELLAALSASHSAEQLAAAFMAGIDAAYHNNREHGVAAALAVLSVSVPVVVAVVDDEADEA